MKNKENLLRVRASAVKQLNTGDFGYIGALTKTDEAKLWELREKQARIKELEERGEKSRERITDLNLETIEKYSKLEKQREFKMSDSVYSLACEYANIRNGIYPKPIPTTTGMAKGSLFEDRARMEAINMGLRVDKFPQDLSDPNDLGIYNEWFTAHPDTAIKIDGELIPLPIDIKIKEEFEGFQKINDSDEINNYRDQVNTYYWLCQENGDIEKAKTKIRHLAGWDPSKCMLVFVYPDITPSQRLAWDSRMRYTYTSIVSRAEDTTEDEESTEEIALLNKRIDEESKRYKEFADSVNAIPMSKRIKIIQFDPDKARYEESKKRVEMLRGIVAIIVDMQKEQDTILFPKKEDVVARYIKNN